ncbi:hypothetical protein AA313_de0201365 [Arthrobotrys entomopaga]|nr:hypothetical protein AA313_de0201365 [Arthrobotrys entomopaga]
MRGTLDPSFSSICTLAASFLHNSAIFAHFIFPASILSALVTSLPIRLGVPLLTYLKVPTWRDTDNRSYHSPTASIVLEDSETQRPFLSFEGFKFCSLASY